MSLPVVLRIELCRRITRDKTYTSVTIKLRLVFFPMDKTKCFHPEIRLTQIRSKFDVELRVQSSAISNYNRKDSVARMVCLFFVLECRQSVCRCIANHCKVALSFWSKWLARCRPAPAKINSSYKHKAYIAWGRCRDHPRISAPHLAF